MANSRPSSKADFAFVQHMVHQLDDNGTMAIVLPHGFCFVVVPKDTSPVFDWRKTTSMP
jgi:hypothetical protein